MPGHWKNRVSHWFTTERGSSPLGIFTSPFLETNGVKLAFNLATLYYFGASAISLLGVTNFLILYGGASVATSAI